MFDVRGILPCREMQNILVRHCHTEEVQHSFWTSILQFWALHPRAQLTTWGHDKYEVVAYQFDTEGFQELGYWDVA